MIVNTLRNSVYLILPAILLIVLASKIEAGSDFRKDGDLSSDGTGNKKDTGFFWHISDIHWDQEYSIHGDPKRMCHDFPDYRSPENAGNFGNFYCDAPWKLVNASIQAMRQLKPNPDFIIWTGDNSPHTYNPTPNWTTIFTGLKKISLLLSKSFPGVPILPVIGNHDTQPPDVITPNSTYYGQYLLRGGWDMLLPPNTTARETFDKGGFYNVSVGTGLQVIGLNTLLWWQRNKNVANVSDPAEQFAWLETVLENAVQKGDKVYLIGHVPPGFYARTSPEKEGVVYYPQFNTRYIQLVNKYKDSITGQLFGHQHYDTFMLFQDETDKPSGAILLGPSITPWHSTWPKEDNSSVPVNPAVRLFTYARSHGTLLDHEQYYLNLTKANSDDQPNMNLTSGNITWQLLYRFSTEYNLPDLSAHSLDIHYERIANNENVYKKYIYYATSAKDVGKCEDFCKTSHLCSMRYVNEDGYYKCMNTTKNSTHSMHENATTTASSTSPTEPTKTTIFPSRFTYYKAGNNEESSTKQVNRTASVEGIVIGCIACMLVLIAIVATAWWRHKRSTYVVRYMPFA